MIYFMQKIKYFCAVAGAGTETAAGIAAGAIGKSFINCVRYDFLYAKS